MSLPAQPEAAWHEDEPNELSWEHLAGSLACFEMFEKEYAGTGEPKLPAVKLPSMVTTIKVPATVLLGEASKATWRAGQESGRPVIIGPAGHVGAAAKAVIDVPAAGTYRLWVRWKNTPGKNASNRVRLRPGATDAFTFGWQSVAQADYLDFKTGFVPTKRPGYAVDYPADKAGMIWSGSQTVELPAGKVLLDIAPTIHEGPFATRIVEQFGLTTDVINRPSDVDAQVPVPQSITVTQEKPRPEDQNRWTLWAIRPGSGSPDIVSAKPTLPGYHGHERRFRSALIERLAAGKNLTPDEKHLAQLVYFDEEWNLIGTPAQVAQRVKELGDPKNIMAGYMQWVEAETFDVKSGWTTESQTDASAGRALGASYSDGPALAVGLLNAPKDGEYKIWVRFAQIKGYHNTFELAIYQGGEKTFEKPFHEMGSAGSGYVYVWQPVEVKLKAGKVEVHLTKSRGKSPYAYRRVDALVLTDDLSWAPTGTQLPLPGKGMVASAGLEKAAAKNDVVIWTGAPDDKFTGLPWGAWPTRQDVEKTVMVVVPPPRSQPPGAPSDGVAPSFNEEITRDAIQLEGRPGATVSRVIRVTNPTDKRQVLALRVKSPDGLGSQVRVVGFQITADKSWVAMPLLARRQICIAPMTTAYVWVDAQVPQKGTAKYEVTIGLKTVTVEVAARGEFFDPVKAPLAGGWCSPPSGVSGWKMFEESGLNLICGVVLSKQEMKAFKIRIFAVPLGEPKTREEVDQTVAGMKAMGLDYADWAWIISDEPNEKAVAAWVAAAKVIRDADPKVQIWCNPGEVESSKPEVVKAMTPFIDIFCPYANHFGERLPEDYRVLVRATGKLKLVYTTPCFHEKAPGAPLELLGLAASAKKLGRDGFNCFALFNYYGYTASAWDEVNAPFPDQAVSIYPGAWGRAISSRNLEAVRQAVQEW